jgi:type IV pilus assembly protein PilM
MFAGVRNFSNLLKLSTAPRTGAIGLDLATEKLHLMQMEQVEGNFLRIRAASSTAYGTEREALVADPRALKVFIRKALASKPFHGRRIVTCLPPEQLRLLSFSYRLGAAQSEAEAIMKAVRERLGDEWDDSVVDYLPIRKGDYERGERAALVVCAQRTDVIAYLELFRQAGLTVDAIEIGPLAIKRLVTCMSDGRQHELVLAINFGRSKSYLTAVSGKRLLLDRELDFGERQIIDRLGQHLGLSGETALSLLYQYGFCDRALLVANGPALQNSSELVEILKEIIKPMFRTLAEEINRVSLYLASETHGDTPKRLLLLGSIARWAGADALLSHLIHIPVEVLNPFSAFLARSDGAVLADLDPIAGIALATGLALRGLDAHA